jgi:hypothetical protein
MLAAMRWVVGRLPRGLRASDADRPVRVYAVPVPERPSVVHSSHYPPEPVYQVRRKIDRSVVQRLLSGLSAISPREKHCRSDVFACAFQLAWLQTLPATLVPRAGPVALWGLASCARAVIFRGQMPSATRAL